MRKLVFLLFLFGLTTCFAQIQPTKEALDKVMTFHTSATIGEESDFYIASAKTFWIDWGNGVWKAYPAAGAAFYAGGILKGSTVRVAGQKVWNGYCPQNVCKLQSSYICGDFKNQTKNNEAYI